MIHLIYASAATSTFTDAGLAALLQQARAANTRADVTGILLHTNGSFFQILEGPEAIVDPLFEHIASDARHHRATVIIHEPIVRRSFEEWTMGFSRLKASEVGAIVGANEFFDDPAYLTRLTTGRAKKLLAAFASGRWRSGISGAPQSTAA